MAEMALGNRERHGTVTETALLALQNIIHTDIGRTDLRFEQLLMAVVATKPLRVNLVGEEYSRKAAFQIQQHIHIEYLHLVFGRD